MWNILAYASYAAYATRMAAYRAFSRYATLDAHGWYADVGNVTANSQYSRCRVLSILLLIASGETARATREKRQCDSNAIINARVSVQEIMAAVILCVCVCVFERIEQKQNKKF